MHKAKTCLELAGIVLSGFGNRASALPKCTLFELSCQFSILALFHRQVEMRTLCIHLARRKRLSMAQLLPLEKAEDFCSGFLGATASLLHGAAACFFNAICLYCPDKPRRSTCRRFLPRPHHSTNHQAEYLPRVTSRDRPVAAINDDSVTCPQLVKVMAGISRVSVSQGLIATQTWTSVPRTVTSSRESRRLSSMLNNDT